MGDEILQPSGQSFLLRTTRERSRQISLRIDMHSTSLLVAALLCVGINAENLLPRQSINIITPVADPTLVPDASGKPTTPTITVTAVVTCSAPLFYYFQSSDIY